MMYGIIPLTGEPLLGLSDIQAIRDVINECAPGFLTVVIMFWFFLCSSSDGRPFRLGSGANMEKVVRMDREMTRVCNKNGK